MEARRREHERNEEREEPEVREPSSEREPRERRERIGPVEREQYVYESRLAEHRDIVHWGPVWVGLISAYGVLIVLALLAAAVGFSAATPGTALGAPGGAFNTGTAVASVVAVLISFFAGGWMAGRTSSAKGNFVGIALGTSVWGLGLLLLMLITAIGIGGLFNVFGGFFGAFGGAQTGVTPGTAARMAAGPAVTALIGVVLTWIVTVLGATVGIGTRSPEIEGY